MRDVTGQFYINDIDPHELVQHLISKFQKCTFSALDRIDIPEADNPRLQIYFTSSGQVQKIGTDLADKELKPVISELKELFLGPTRYQVRRFVDFAHAPVTGTWECKMFTITKAPPEAPRPQQFLADHPYILEVPFKATGNDFVDIHRAMRMRARYELPTLALHFWIQNEARPLERFLGTRHGGSDPFGSYTAYGSGVL